MDDEAVDLLRDLIAEWAGHRPHRTTVRAWLVELRGRAAAGRSPTGPVEPVAWRITYDSGGVQLTDHPETARMMHDLGARVVPLFTRS